MANYMTKTKKDEICRLLIEKFENKKQMLKIMDEDNEKGNAVHPDDYNRVIGAYNAITDILVQVGIYEVEA